MVVGGAIALADLRWARFYPRTVAAIRADHPNAEIYFSGHWGFQWYAERAGMTAWDIRRFDAPTGSLIAVAQRADPTPLHPLVQQRLHLLREYVLPPASLG